MRCKQMHASRPFPVALALILATLACLVFVSTALAASRTYYGCCQWHAAGTRKTDLQNHNHSFNDGCWATSTGLLKRVYELTPNTQQIHFVMDGTGNCVVSWHDPTYYDAPYCWNRSSVSLWSQGCTAEWSA